MSGELRVQLSEDGADAERLDLLTGYLRRELLQLDVEDVVPFATGEPPPDGRGYDLAAMGGLLVTFGRSLAGLRSVVSAIGKWLRRGAVSGRVVRLEIDGDVLELSGATEAEQERLVELFISRHMMGEVG